MRSCDLNERPGTPPACLCDNNRSVSHNGKCQ
jgi:hypothetical protein